MGFTFGNKDRRASQGSSGPESEARDDAGSIPDGDTASVNGNDTTGSADGNAYAKRRIDPRTGKPKIGRPTKEEAAAKAQKQSASGSGPKAKEKLAVNPGDFVRNDRAKVRDQIQALHSAAALLTKQPVWLLNDVEAKVMSEALCDVLDEHKINLSSVVGVWGMYAVLIQVSFNVYAPRVLALSMGGGQTVNGTVTPGPEQAPQGPKTNPQGGKMNFEDMTVDQMMGRG